MGPIQAVGAILVIGGFLVALLLGVGLGQGVAGADRMAL
jgi:hypothetical protein